MRSIVDAYVRLKNRSALEEMRMHRHHLKVSLYFQGEERHFSVSPVMQSLDGDLSAIEAGLERL
jgi:hypothetical protein